MKTEIFKKISKIISINLKILALLIIIFEVFFGYYFRENNFGYIMRFERQKDQLYEVIHNGKKYIYNYKRNFYGFRGREIDPSEIKIIFQGKNMGKGNSIIEGIKIATGNYIIFQDADLEYSPQNYNLLLKKIIDDNLDAVFGSRIKNNADYHVYYLNKLAVLIFTKLINFFYNGQFTDTATNHKLIKTKILKNMKLESKSFALDFEISIKLSKLKIKYDEVAIDYKPRKYNEGKKINMMDALKSIYVIIINLIKKY